MNEETIELLRTEISRLHHAIIRLEILAYKTNQVVPSRCEEWCGTQDGWIARKEWSAFHIMNNGISYSSEECYKAGKCARR